MTARPPAEVEVVCLARECRRPTLHALKASLSGGRALYGCTAGCRSAIREISQPHEKTPAARSAEKELTAAQVARWKREKSDETPIDARVIAAIREVTETKPDQETNTTMKDKLISLIRKTVAEQVGEQEKPLTEDHVRGIIREELEKLLADDDAPTGESAPPRRPAAPASCQHKNFMRKCEGCRARKGSEE
jgi:hypothetical protein